MSAISRQLLPAAPLLLLAAALAADSIHALARGWRPENGAEAVATALSYLPLLTCATLTRPTVRAWLGMHSRDLLLQVAALAVAITILELGARELHARVVVQRNFHTRGPNIDATIKADPNLLPGISGPARYRTDRLGIRAPWPPKPRAQRWLAVGGSTTECVYLDDERTWPALLMHAAGPDNIWIGNIGISGYDTRQHLRMLEEGILTRGIDGLIIQCGINDLWRFAANEEEMAIIDRFGDGLKVRVKRKELEAPPPLPWRPLWARSHTLTLLRTLRDQRTPPKASAPEGQGGAEYVKRRAVRAAAEKTSEAPDWEKGAREYAERVRTIIHTARGEGMKLTFLTQPVLWSEPPSPEAESRCWLGWRQDGRYYELGVLAQGMQRYNEALMEVCTEEQVPCVDLSSISANPAYFYDDCHYTEAGARAVAELTIPQLNPLL